MRTEAGDIVLALDAMGGDHGPSVILPGAARALEMRPELRFVIFGDVAAIEYELTKLPALHARATVHHTDVSIAMDDKPSQAIRKGRKTSSMWQTIDAVKRGEAQAAVSAGNTGALMAMAKVILKTIDGVSRPAIAAIWPTLRGRSVVLDVGATVGAVTEQLVANSVMGAAMARCLFGVRNPSVGLLNIGVEEVKGVEPVREAGAALREAELPLTYAGFIEGSDIGRGTTDVVVTEGFSGNIALKTAEGTAVQVATVLKEELQGGLLSKLGAFLALKALKNFKSRLDPRRHNGGVFLGLNGVVVKSHGGIDAEGVASAVNVAADMVENDLVDRIIKGMELAQPEPHEDEQDRSQASA